MTASSSRSRVTSDRRAFLCSAAGAGAIALCGSSGCTVPVRSRPVSLGATAEIRLAEFPELERAGGIVRLEDRGRSRSVYVRRNDDGTHEGISAICTHQGCVVRPSGGGFRCPCHGSSYDRDGGNVTGPARRPLTRFRVTREGEVLVLRLAPGSGETGS